MAWSAWVTWPRDLYYNLGGSVSPDQTARIKEETATGIKKASAGADSAVIAERQRQADSEIDATLRSMPGGSAHPDDADFFGSSLKRLQKLVNVALVIGGVVVAVYFFGFVLRALKFAKGGR